MNTGHTHWIFESPYIISAVAFRTLRRPSPSSAVQLHHAASSLHP
uniref:Uncharacterized protein n=1 Tax=Arundo donax TaxID=35708 RepID=A0A0A9A7N0_ARUDO